jgi:hypothetical protein
LGVGQCLDGLVTRVVTFSVTHNQFSGTIPSQLGTAWRGLRMASFVNNSLVSSGSGNGNNGDKVDMPLCAVHNALANKVIYADCAVACSCCLDRDQCN